MQTEVATAKWETIFELKDKGNRFQITVKLGECEDVFAIQWYYNQLAKSEGGSVGDSYSSEFRFSSRETAIKTVIGQINRSIMKHLPHFKGYGWAGKFLDKNPEASPNYKAPETQYLEHINEMRGFEVQTEAATDVEEQEEERLSVYLLPEQWKVAEKALCTSDIVNGQKAKIFEHLYTEHVVCSAMSNGKNEGWKDLAGYIIVPLAGYNGDLEPLKYGPHFSEVYKGTRKRSYVGMLIDTKNGKYVCTHGVEFFLSESDAPTPKPKIKAKPKAATPKRRVVEHNREYWLNFGEKIYKVNKHDVCLNPDESVIFKNKQWEFIAKVAFLEDAWRNGYKFSGKDWGNMGPVSTIGDAFESEAGALLNIGEYALKRAIDNKAPVAAIKAIQEFISNNRQLANSSEVVEFIWDDGFCENPLIVAIAKAGKWNFNAFVASDKKGWYESAQFEAPGWYSKMVLSDLDPHPTKADALLKIGNTALEMAIENKAPAGLIKQIQEFISHKRQLANIGQLVQDIEVNGIDEAKTEEHEPIKTQLVDGHQQIVLFDVPATEKKADPNAALFGYIAKNRTERQAFKRKLQRTTDWLDGLPADQRAAILKAIAAYTPPPQAVENK